MELDNQRSSDNVDDRRGSIGVVGGGIGIGGVVIALIAMFLGVDPQQAIDMATQMGEEQPQRQQQPAPNQGAPDSGKIFVQKVLGSTEDVWTRIFTANGKQYELPRLVLFSGATRTSCGTGQAAMGPFYCPGDRMVYIDLSFYRDLRERFHAPGEFAQAYVIAHEVGHHVQNLLGVTGKTDALRARMTPTEYNKVSVQVELQADCFAGVWAHHASEAIHLVPGDLEQGLTAAAAIGDDRLQKQSQGYVVPESFTHGSSAQRVQWFKRGMDSGRVSDCDTFASR
jgi:predicted metalloprotease